MPPPFAAIAAITADTLIFATSIFRHFRAPYAFAAIAAIGLRRQRRRLAFAASFRLSPLPPPPLMPRRLSDAAADAMKAFRRLRFRRRLLRRCQRYFQTLYFRIWFSIFASKVIYAFAIDSLLGYIAMPPAPLPLTLLPPPAITFDER